MCALFFQNCATQFSLDMEKLGESQQTSDTNNPDAFNSVQDPVIKLVSKLDPIVNTSSLELIFTVDFGGSKLKTVTCQMDALPATDCSKFQILYSNLVDGSHSLTIHAENQVGKSADLVKTFLKDTQAPVISFVVSSLPSTTTNQQIANISFTTLESGSGINSLECSIDGGAYSKCTSPVQLSGLSIGAHSLAIKSTDKAMNASSILTHNWVIDLTAPTVIISSTPAVQTNLTTAAFSFSGSGTASFECQLDSAAFAKCTSPVNYTGLSSANHTFKVRGTSASGVVSAVAQAAWLVDTIAPPAPVITANVAASTSLTAATLSFASTADSGSGLKSYQCALDAASFAVCTSSVTVSALSIAQHTFKVKAIDNVSNESVVSVFTWTVTAVPDWVVPPITLTEATGTFRLADTLPVGIVKGGTFSVDPAGTPLPSKMKLNPDGLLEVGAETALTAPNTAGVVFAYTEP